MHLGSLIDPEQTFFRAISEIVASPLTTKNAAISPVGSDLLTYTKMISCITPDTVNVASVETARAQMGTGKCFIPFAACSVDSGS